MITRDTQGQQEMKTYAGWNFGCRGMSQKEMLLVDIARRKGLKGLCFGNGVRSTSSAFSGLLSKPFFRLSVARWRSSS